MEVEGLSAFESAHSVVPSGSKQGRRRRAPIGVPTDSIRVADGSGVQWGHRRAASRWAPIASR